MGLIAKNTGGDYELAPEGMAVARCYRIIDLGTQSVIYKDAEKSAHKISISWEMPEELMKDGRPFSIFQQFTLSLHKKSTLRPVLESWRGRKFTDEEAEGFDITKLLGVPCFINIVHVKAGDTIYANIAAITPLLKGTTCPPAVNTPVLFNLDRESFDQKVYDSFSEKLKEKIAASPEYNALHSDVNEQAQGEEGDIPF